MITLLNPLKLQERTDILNELKDYGIDHLSKDPKYGWNYALDHIWIVNELDSIIPKLKNAIIIDAGCGKSLFHQFLEKRYSINIIGVDRPSGFCNQDKTNIVDYSIDFLEFDAFNPGTIDIIYWLSSIEHNPIATISLLFRKSMDLLRINGHFMATCAISDKTQWFEPSQQTNLSINDCLQIFQEDNIEGDLKQIQSFYKDSDLFLIEKYRRRYHKYWVNNPEFVVAGIHQSKTSQPEK